MSSRITVCSLNALEQMLEETAARHMISLVNSQMMPETPSCMEKQNHLKLAMNDIEFPVTGSVLPSPAHVGQLVAFSNGPGAGTSLIIHCLAGISRSTAAAFIVLCVRNPDLSARRIAWFLRERSPTATPNRRLVACADEYLQREGEMIAAIREIGRGETAPEGVPFSVPAILDGEI